MDVIHNKYGRIMDGYIYFVMNLLASIIYVFGFYLFFGRDFQTITWSLAHTILAAIINFNLLSKVEKRVKANRFTITAIFLIVASIYFQLSAIKYCEYNLYPNFISNNKSRFLGSLIVGLILLITIEFWFKLKLKKPDLQETISNINAKFNLGFGFIFVAVVLMGILTVLSIRNNSTSFYLNDRVIQLSTTQQFQNTMIELLLSLLLCCVVLYYGKRKGTLLIALLIGVYFFKASFTGNRSTLLSPAVGIISGFIILNKISMKLIKKILLFTPIMIVAMSMIFFSISNRENIGDKDRLVYQFAYRFDLSDYPMTLIQHIPNTYCSIKPVSDAVLLAIPSIINKDKQSIVEDNSYYQWMSNANLNPYLDYTDSIFTMGIEVAGSVGFLLLFPIFVFAIELLDAYASKYGITGIMYKIMIFAFYIRVEFIWSTLFIYIRNLLIYAIVAMIFKKIAFSSSTRNQYKI